MTLARGFAEWAAEVSVGDIPVEVRRNALLCVLDGLGTALAAARMNQVPFAVEVARSLGSGEEATVIGSALPASAAGAAFANGVLMHSLDFDDTHTAGLVHATAMTLPATLAVAQRQGSSGPEFLRALVLGYELAGRLSSAVPHGFHARGFHATSVCGTFTAALTASILSGLSVEQTVNALGIAGSQSSGSMEFLATGASTKQIHPGWSSMAGVLAAAMASGGATGPDTVFEGNHGLFALFATGEADLRSVLADLGASWQVDGVEPKPYPACHLVHRSLDAARRLRSMIDVTRIQEIVVRIPAASVPIVCSPAEVKQRPRSPYEAKFSLQWSVAAMLLDGEVSVDTYRADRIDRPDAGRLSQRVRFEPVDDPRPAAQQPGNLTVRLDGGNVIRVSTDDPSFGDQPTDVGALVLPKFKLNVGAGRAAILLIDAVLGLDDAPHLTELSTALHAVVQEWADDRCQTSGSVS
ncbi:MmgE/PrpD family protein [Mycolicibacterium goodii]|uniref:MmgE/PrpD family protein n=1 Tax=Mycolicibacterium goodii TaxID=134601 RepID=UPI0006733D49